ncbi:nucleoside 2-deoxyribosyltransferase [Candidatus Woesearchaeota archaeon]|nr:nucleoside 2-deoxyribosyltransferase [Candidatus Woesearchaeota archaeon]
MTLDIYFACSISGGRDSEDVARYTALVRHLQLWGNVLSEHFLTLTSTGDKDDTLAHDRDLTWLLQAPITVAEVSTPSHGVGYELGRLAERLSQAPGLHHVLCLRKAPQDKKLSSMIAGCPQLQVRTYTVVDEAFTHIDTFFAALGYQKK